MQPTNALIGRVQSGLAWVADTQLQALAVAGYLRFKAVNTGTNNVYIYSFGGQASATVNMKVQTAVGATTLTNVVTPSNQNIAAKSTSSLTVSWDTNASDITGTYYRTIPIGTTFGTFNDNIVMLQPGQSISISGPFLLSASGIFHLSWFEQTS
jgi:hypothetical protein